MKTKISRPSVLYIGGYGRSGSTLLDTLLGNHDEIFGGGELERFFDDLASDGLCTCGQQYEKCPFWVEILNRLYVQFPNLDPNAVAEQRQHIESTVGRWPISPSRLTAEKELYGDIWATFFEAICEVSGSQFIIDSSKNSRGNSRRIQSLRRYAGLHMQVLHLIRDPRAVAYSEWGRGHNDQLEYKTKLTRAGGGIMRPLMGWAMANIAVSMAQYQDKTLNVHRVHYEELAENTTQTLREISSFLDCDLTSVIDMLEAGKPLQSGHGVRGNRMRRQGPIKIKVDYEWIESMPQAAHFYTRTLWPIARQYGYDVSKWPAIKPQLSTKETNRPLQPPIVPHR